MYVICKARARVSEGWPGGGEIRNHCEVYSDWFLLKKLLMLVFRGVKFCTSLFLALFHWLPTCMPGDIQCAIQHLLLYAICWTKIQQLRIWLHVFLASIGTGKQSQGGMRPYLWHQIMKSFMKWNHRYEWNRKQFLCFYKFKKHNWKLGRVTF